MESSVKWWKKNGQIPKWKRGNCGENNVFSHIFLYSQEVSPLYRYYFVSSGKFIIKKKEATNEG